MIATMTNRPLGFEVPRGRFVRVCRRLCAHASNEECRARDQEAAKQGQRTGFGDGLLAQYGDRSAHQRSARYVGAKRDNTGSIRESYPYYGRCGARSDMKTERFQGDRLTHRDAGARNIVLTRAAAGNPRSSSPRSTSERRSKPG